MANYDHKSIESAWQKIWEDEQTFAANDQARGERAYILDMFPYPSAQGLHVGHPEGYTATDIYSRYARMRGVNVLHPMGWDAFGLPAENFAIKTGRHPRITTEENITNIKRQIKSLGFSYDWSRELNTSDPKYYRWTQWLFLQLYKKGLAYRQAAPVNWCPSCQTVLANEQVVNGVCERCSTPVEQRQMQQWFFKITAYAKELLSGMADLDWPQPILDMQRNWIGESQGALVNFQIPNANFQIREITIFTTRLDTIFGATFMVISPELAKKWLAAGWQASVEVINYVNHALHGRELERVERAAKEKTGVDTGIKAINPASQEEIPVWVADYVLGSYGTGAIMAVPAHDERDFAFAKKFGLPVKRVVEPKFVRRAGEGAFREDEKVVKRQAVCCIVKNPKDGKYLCLSWKQLLMHGLVTGDIAEGEDIVTAAVRAIHEATGYKHVRLVRNPEFAIHSFFYHRVKQQNHHVRYQYLFFELVNEEREPVAGEEAARPEVVWLKPEEFKDFFTVSEGEFSSQLLFNPDYIHKGDGILWNSGEFSGLASAEAVKQIAKQINAQLTTQYKLHDWLISRQRYWGAPIPIIYCQVCGEVPVPENDLPVRLPDDVDFKPTGESPLARSASFQKVACPKCGAPAKRESDTMDTFVDSAWYFLRYCDPNNDKEIFAKKKVQAWCPVDFYVGGAEHAVLHLLYARFISKVLRDLGYLQFDEPFLKLRNQGLILGEDGQKMSKSRGNVINPDEIVANYGADTLRLYEMFMGPLEEAKPWSTASIIGVRRFLERVWKLILSTAPSQAIKLTPAAAAELSYWVAKTTKKVTEDIISFRFNTAIASLMEFTNYLSGVKLPSAEQIKVGSVLLRLLYPFAPHITAELWQRLGRPGRVWEQTWPEYDPKALQHRQITIAVQVNGKLRGQVRVAAETEEADVLALARANSCVARYLSGRKLKRTVYVPGKLVSFVVE
jgi:leucyl-tRNA synthetase